MAWCPAGGKAVVHGGDSTMEFVHGLFLFQGLLIQISEFFLL